MKKALLLLLPLLLGTLSLSAQLTVWTGAGDGTSWDDAANWSTNAVPDATVGVIFEDETVVTVTGGAPAPIARLVVDTAAQVTLDLDLSIGGEDVAVQGIIIRQDAALTLGGTEERLFGVGNDGTVDAVLLNGANATLTLNAPSFLFVQESLNGISIVAAGAAVINNGVITANGYDTNGIRVVTGRLENNGDLEIGSGATMVEDLGDGLNVGPDGTFDNTAAGNLTISSINDDAVTLLGTINNDGVINIALRDDAPATSFGVLLGTAAFAGMLNNAGTVNLNAGAGEEARALLLGALGGVDNSGTLNVSGGQPGSSLLNRGNFTNQVCGVVNLVSVRMLNNVDGVFVNNGLFKSSFTGPALNSPTGSVTNNGFYAYANPAIPFAIGDGEINDNGLRARDTVDFAMACAIADLGLAAPHVWYADAAAGQEIGQNDASGALAVADDAFTAPGTQSIYSCYGEDVVLTLENVAGDCVDEDVATRDLIVTEFFNLAPNPARDFVRCTFNEEFAAVDKTLFLQNAVGQIVFQASLPHQSTYLIPFDDLSEGLHFLTIRTDGETQTSILIIAR